MRLSSDTMAAGSVLHRCAKLLHNATAWTCCESCLEGEGGVFFFPFFWAHSSIFQCSLRRLRTLFNDLMLNDRI